MDAAIPTWAKGCISAALYGGGDPGLQRWQRGSRLGAEDSITQGEATVMLNNLLNVADVPLEVFAAEGSGTHWWPARPLPTWRPPACSGRRT